MNRVSVFLFTVAKSSLQLNGIQPHWLCKHQYLGELWWLLYWSWSVGSFKDITWVRAKWLAHFMTTENLSQLHEDHHNTHGSMTSHSCCMRGEKQRSTASDRDSASLPSLELSSRLVMAITALWRELGLMALFLSESCSSFFFSFFWLDRNSRANPIAL